MEIVTINGIKRTETGKKATKAVRKEGLVPCVIYGGSEVVHFTAAAMDFRDLIFTPEFKLAEITVEGQTRKCIVKDMQFHPVSDGLVHLDFVELVPNQKVLVEVPVRYKGVAPGVKTGGKLIALVRRVKIKTTLESLVNALYVDISKLELGASVRVRDIDVPDGIELMNNGSIPVAAVEIPRALRSKEAAVEGAATPAPAAAE